MPSPNAPNGTIAKIQRLLAYHEKAAGACRTVLQLLQVERREIAETTVIEKALQLDQERRVASGLNGHPQSDGSITFTEPAKKRGRPKTARPGGASAANFKSQKQQRRERTLSFLSRFNPNDPVTLTGPDMRNNGIGILVKHNYLKRKGEGYIRTPREFTV